MAENRKIVYPDGELYWGECIEVMSQLPEKSVDLVIGSPPYEDQRTYREIGFKLVGQAWVDWMVKVFEASLRVCKGLVAFVVGNGKHGPTKWSAVPALLIADLHRKGIILRSPAIYERNGVPGSGADDWLRNDYEWIICATSSRKLPWSDNTACGHPPKYGKGGEMSNRTKDGTRVNQWGASRKASERQKNGQLKKTPVKPSHRFGEDVGAIANPGNVIDCTSSDMIHCTVGGGKMGSNIAHEGDAPYPSKIPNFFIRSFCPPGGVTCDPFSGSGSTVSEAIKLGRRFIGIDLRESEIKLTQRRIEQARSHKGFTA